MDYQLTPISFDDLHHWPDDNHAAAMETFLQSARLAVIKPYKTRTLGVSADRLAAISARALQAAPFDRGAARWFFEAHFEPCEIADRQSRRTVQGFVTAYYEPQVLASRHRGPEFPAPLYRRPEDLIDITRQNRPVQFDPDCRFGRMGSDGIEEFPDRPTIEAGCLKNRGLEIAWLKNKVEALFIHIQGSACLRFQDGSTARIGYAAKSGHPYTAVGSILLQRGAVRADDCGMQAIRAWFAKNPEATDEIINQNRSFIFFKLLPDGQLSPTGAARVALSDGRSLAIDRNFHTFGGPIWVETELPLPEQLHGLAQLMIAQDTGSAIIGPARGDLYLGSGEGAGKIAGDVRHRARFVVLRPRG